MSTDERMRELERKAAAGDRDAAEKLRHQQQRIFQETIFSCCEPGDWIYLENGPNYHECAVLERVFLDEIGRAVAVLGESWRKENEHHGQKPTWLLRTGTGGRVPSTSVTWAQPAKERWQGFTHPSETFKNNS